VNETSELKLEDYASSSSDKTSLAKIDGKAFTVTAVERYDYDEKDLGVLITTQETFDIDGNGYDKFYTTRVAVVGKFLEDGRNDPAKRGTFTKFALAINEGNTAKVKCIKKRAEKSNKDYFDLESA
jgi:hypothetical protein